MSISIYKDWVCVMKVYFHTTMYAERYKHILKNIKSVKKKIAWVG